MTYIYCLTAFNHRTKSKAVPRQAEAAQGVPGKLRPRISSTFRHYKDGRASTKIPAAFTPGEIPGTNFHILSRPQGTWFCEGTTEKIPSDTNGNVSPDLPIEPEYRKCKHGKK